MRNEKAAVEAAAQKKLTNTMKQTDNTSTENNFQLNFPPPRQELLEQSKLSLLPKLPPRHESRPLRFDPPGTTPAAAACVGCGGRLDRDDNFQQSIRACRKCISIYARIDTRIEENARRKKKKQLERFAAEVVKR